MGEKKGRQIGLEEGIQIGQKRGIQIGREEGMLDAARGMKTKGYPLEDIAQITGPWLSCLTYGGRTDRASLRGGIGFQKYGGKITLQCI